MDDKTKNLMELIDVAANEPIVKQDKVLFGQLVEAYQRLDKGDLPTIVCNKIKMTSFLMKNKNDLPKSVVDLAKEISKLTDERFGRFFIPVQ